MEEVGLGTLPVKRTGETPTIKCGTSIKGCCIAYMLCLETNVTAVALGKFKVQKSTTWKLVCLIDH